jgi:CBS domain-containing protein
MRTVKDMLSSKKKSFNVISPEETVFDALQMLNAVNLSYLIVMENDAYKGIFCERDYSRNVILKGRTSTATKVKDVMTVDLPVVTLEDTAEKCMHLIDDYKTRYLLVFDDEKFEGVITINDLLRQVLSAREDVFENSIAFKLLDQDERIF